jgi:hypothetical protein
MPDDPKPPTTERGYSSTVPPPMQGGVASWVYWSSPDADTEDVPALQWPLSVSTLHKMRTDAQISALLLSITLPVRRRHWAINPNGARDEAVAQIAMDLDLPIVGTDERPRSPRRRFSHDDHLRMALLALVYGHQFFEQFGIIDDNLDWRLRKLAPRLPQSIAKINVARDGGLESIVQKGAVSQAWRSPDPIPVDALVAYPWDKEGANWVGRSLLRSCYKPWVLKDRGVRVDAMKNERYGLGIPVGRAPAGGDPDKYSQMAQAIRAGDTSGVGLPAGADIGIEGVRGSLPDTLASIEFYNEEMARSFLAMFMQLGSTKSGSRALGTTFVDFFEMAVDAVAGWYARITTEHVIEDIIDWNFSVDENAPELVWIIEEDHPLAVTDLVALMDKGLIDLDDEMRGWIRERYSLPAGATDGIGEPIPGSTTTTTPAPVAARRGAAGGDKIVVAHQQRGAKGRYTSHTHAAGDSENGVTGPRVTFVDASGATRVTGSSQTVGSPTVGHRAPNAHEVRAAVNFDGLQQAWQQATDNLVTQWQSIRTQQIDHLVSAIEAAVAAGDATMLANIAAPVLGADVIYASLRSAAEDAIGGAVAEAAAQGVTITTAEVSSLEVQLLNRAEATATLLARSLSESAARQALMRYGVNTVAATDVAAAVRAHLEGLTDSYLNDQLGGALTGAQNAGRAEVFSEGPVGTYYASELMDLNTCELCAAMDGTTFDTLEEAEMEYPTGGYSECEGGSRCRGTLVAIYESEEDPTIEAV